MHSFVALLSAEQGEDRVRTDKVGAGKEVELEIGGAGANRERKLAALKAKEVQIGCRYRCAGLPFQVDWRIVEVARCNVGVGSRRRKGEEFIAARGCPGEINSFGQGFGERT